LDIIHLPDERLFGHLW